MKCKRYDYTCNRCGAWVKAGDIHSCNTTSPSWTNITTTSTSDVLMQGMEITSVPAGDYFLSFGNTFNHSSNGESILTTIYVGGVEVTNSLMGWTRGNAQGDIYT